jgi:hypothetical protein
VALLRKILLPGGRLLLRRHDGGDGVLLDAHLRVGVDLHQDAAFVDLDDGYLLVAGRRSRICASSTPRVRDAG